MPYSSTNGDQRNCDSSFPKKKHGAQKKSKSSIDCIRHDEDTVPSVVDSTSRDQMNCPDVTRHPNEDLDQHPSMANRSLAVEFPPKAPISCVYSAGCIEDLHGTKPDLIYTHGAGGTLQSEAMVNFTQGFVNCASRSKICCFKGNMNLKSRVKMFAAVIESWGKCYGHGANAPATNLGGRSMGARAAVMAAIKDTCHLVLVSYPLHTGKEIRDEILLDLPDSIKVIFVSGANDVMCELDRLEVVRKKMKCKTWRVVVQDADHGMNMKPKAGTQDVGRKTGEIVANWLDNSNEEFREAKIWWDPEAGISRWSGWLLDGSAPSTFHDENQGDTENEDSGNRLPLDRKAKPRPKRGRDVSELESSLHADQSDIKRAKHTRDVKTPRPTRPAEAAHVRPKLSPSKPKRRRKT